jgi:hypothetical protein
MSSLRVPSSSWFLRVLYFCLFVCLSLVLSILPTFGQDIPLIPAETSQIITITDGSARLIYRAGGAQQVMISARVQSPVPLDLTLMVLDASDTPIAFNDDHAVEYTRLGERDPLLTDLTLTAGDYTLVIRTFDGTGSGAAEVMVTTAPAPPDETQLAALNTGREQIEFSVPQFNVFDYPVQVYAGQKLTISARALTPNFDPILELLDASLTLIGSNDDHDGDDPALEVRDAQISNYEVGETATFIARVRGFAGGGGNVELTILREVLPVEVSTPPLRAELTLDGSVGAGGVFEQSFDAERGDIISILVSASDTLLEPRLALVDVNRRPLATAERTSPTNAPVIIERYLVQVGGSYLVQVRGFYDTGGDFKLVIRHEARDVPLTQPDVTRIGGAVASGEPYTTQVLLQAGDYVSLAVLAGSFGFDPYLLLTDPDGNALQLNDDHGTSNPLLGLLDAQITHYPITMDGDYGIEIGGYNASAGTFSLIIETLRGER